MNPVLTSFHEEELGPWSRIEVTATNLARKYLTTGQCVALGQIFDRPSVIFTVSNTGRRLRAYKNGGIHPT